MCSLTEAELTAVMVPKLYPTLQRGLVWIDFLKNVFKTKQVNRATTHKWSHLCELSSICTYYKCV